MFRVTYQHDNLHRSDKHHQELHQVVSVLLSQAVSAIHAACSGDLCIVQAHVEVGFEKISTIARASPFGNGDNLWVRFLTILLLKLSDEKLNVCNRLLLSRLSLNEIVKPDTTRTVRIATIRGCRSCQSILVLLVTCVIRRVAAERHVADVERIQSPRRRRAGYSLEYHRRDVFDDDEE